jgi:hypothetical protein
MSESQFSRKNCPGNDANFSGSPSQSCRQAFLKSVLAVRNGNAQIDQRCAMFCEPMQRPSDPRLSVTGHRGEKIVHRQQEPSLWVLPALSYRTVLCDHSQRDFDLGTQRAQIFDKSHDLTARQRSDYISSICPKSLWSASLTSIIVQHAW